VTWSFKEIHSELLRVPEIEFQSELIAGLIHDRKLASLLVQGKTSLREALGKIQKSKQEWLSFMGLYPFDPKSPLVCALNYSLKSPSEFKADVAAMLKEFWTSSFEATWRVLKPQYERSLAEKERLFQVCSLSEFALQALLRIKVDESKGIFEAIRGGYRLPFQKIRACHFIPSAFNDRRYWSALEAAENEVYVYFPYFDPSISIDLHGAKELHALVEPELDPALIFRALGDSTRFAIASWIAKTPVTAVELSRILSVSKPTISHHVQQLREAGLISEQFQAGSVLLSLKREALERLSELTVRKLFESNEKPELKMTRKRG
jgi:DNA-binding transcriptional ArsR family regulator